MATRSLLLLLLLAVAVTSKTTPFAGHKQEKLTHLHFYMHDVFSGDKPTFLIVVNGSATSATLFGGIVVADDPLTERPHPKSKEVGRAQGLYASADMSNTGFIMVFNFLITEGEFNGSTLAMHGRNPIMSKLREMPIIGGTGAFIFARGYALAKTIKRVGKNAVVEYDLFIWH